MGLGPTGQGPALHLGRRGIAALGFPAPLAWERNPDPASGGLFDFWNVYDLGAFRDVLRQGALDLTTVIRVTKSIVFNLTLSEEPLVMKHVVHLILQLDEGDEADHFDPALTPFQTLMEPVEVMDWGARTLRDPLPGRAARHLLLAEGVIDTYHFPRMVNAYAMSVGLDLGAPFGTTPAPSTQWSVARW